MSCAARSRGSALSGMPRLSYRPPRLIRAGENFGILLHGRGVVPHRVVRVPELLVCKPEDVSAGRGAVVLLHGFLRKGERLARLAELDLHRGHVVVGNRVVRARGRAPSSRAVSAPAKSPRAM